MSVLGSLMGGGGAAPDSGGGAEDLLQQIVMLMQQYLSLGEETPAFQTVSEALPAIQEAASGGAPMGADPMGGSPMEAEGPAEDAGEPPMSEGTPMDTMQPSSPPSSFGDASAMALEDLKKRRPRP